MTVALTTATPDFASLDIPLLVVALATNPTLTDELKPIDAVTGGALGRALGRRDFRGGRDETLHLAGGEKGIQRVLFVGMGPAADRVASLRRAGAIAGRQANRLGVGRLAFFAGAMNAAEVEAAGLGLIAGAWDFKEMKTAPPADEQRTPLEAATLIVAGFRRRSDGNQGRVGDRRRTFARAASRHAAGQRVHAGLSRRHRARHRAAARHEDHGARPRGDGSREDGIVPVRRAGHVAGSQAHRARVSQGRPRARRPWRSSARVSASTPAASRSSRRRAWSG